MVKFLGAPGTLPPRNLIKKLTGGPMMPMPPSPLMGNQYPNPNGGGNCMHHHAQDHQQVWPQGAQKTMALFRVHPWCLSRLIRNMIFV